MAGAAELAYFINPLSAIVALLTTASYLLFYTPLKLRTSLSTIAGALPGALPAVIGWAAATNTLSIEGWVLFGIVFMWQMPHFLAIAWMYRDEYARAGMPLLPVIEPDGRSTGRQAVLYTAALIPLSMMPTGDRTGHGAIPRWRDHAGRGADVSERRVLREARPAHCPPVVLRIDPVPADPLGAARVRPSRAMSVTDLPALNATLNAVSTVLLITGYVFIRRGDRRRHKACMIAALIVSALFLTSYVIYHAQVGSVPFKRTGWIRTAYFAVLIPHVILAAAIVPPILITASRGLSAKYDKHRRIARWTLPLWLYVSVTGVIVYLMLYQM